MTRVAKTNLVHQSDLVSLVLVGWALNLRVTRELMPHQQFDYLPHMIHLSYMMIFLTYCSNMLLPTLSLWEQINLQRLQPQTVCGGRPRCRCPRVELEESSWVRLNDC